MRLQAEIKTRAHVFYFNGTEPTVIYFVNIPFSMQKGRFLSLNPLLNAGGVISV